MPAGTYDDLQKLIDQWTQDMVNDDEKMKTWVDKQVLNITEKEVALDELFGVK